MRRGRFSLFTCLIFAVQLVTGFCLTGRTSPFLERDSVVVLLVGLPGDLESESTYRDQLQKWLRTLESLRPKQIIALTDSAGDFSLPAAGMNKSLVFLPSSRSNFLSVASLFDTATNHLVVVIWGHGGKQGNTPVFHVRGPRITPEDVSIFADKIGARETHWILCFRGSGFFASKLAGTHRQILASEGDTMFNSDPIEMASMLQLIREDTATGFESFAERVGRATAQWYKERNLARTEEPTLWLPNQKPKLLAATFDENASASLESASPTSSSGLETKVPKEATNSSGPLRAGSSEDISSADLPPAWKELKRVQPQDYADSNAILLRARISYTLAANPAVGADHDEFIQILTGEGKRFGDFDISYSPPWEDINFDECEVMSPEGKLTRLNPDSIREANDELLGDYNAGRRKFFSLPGVVPGAILHVHYRKEWKKFPLPHVSLEIPVSSELPALESTLRITVPKDEPFHFAFENISGSADSPFKTDPIIEQADYGSTYNWHFTNLMAESHEILAPPGQGIALLLSTFPDWSDFVEWYMRLSKLTDEITPEIKAKAAELSREAETEREKILSIYNYVASLRYVAIPLGVNSFRPHAAANVFKNQFGDCKDKANLFNTMLRSLHIDANLVLVPRFRQAYDALPGFAFNHAISQVNLGEETLWVDTTDDVCRFGMLPPGDSGRKVLVIADKTNSLTQLPFPGPSGHKLIIRGEIDCSQGTETLPAKFDVVAFGYPDYELRESARDAKERAGSLAILSARYRLSAGSFALEKQTSIPVAALDQDFKWSAHGAMVGLLSNLPEQSAAQSSRVLRDVLLRSAFWLPKEWDIALNYRRSALFLNQGYPLTLDEKIEFTLSTKSRIAALPSRVAGGKGALKWNLAWERAGDNAVNVSLNAELSKGELSEAEIAIFQQELRALISALNQAAILELPTP